MIIKVICHSKREPLQLIHDDLVLLRWEVDKDSEASLRAVLDAKLLNTLLYAVLRMHEVNYLIAQVLSLKLSITLVLKGSCNCDVQVDEACYVSGVDDREIFLVGASKRCQALFTLLKLFSRYVLILALELE